MIDFNKFSKDISDEMLAAYIDGNSTDEEKTMIENSIQEDSILSEAVDIANDTKMLSSNFDWDLHEGDFGFWELGLPPILDDEHLSIAADIDDVNLENDNIDVFAPHNVIMSNEDNFIGMESSHLDEFEGINTTDDSIDIDDNTDLTII